MPKSTSYANSLVNLLFRATAIANIADNAASSPITNIEAALHTANLTAATGTQTENETSYTNYTRIPVARSGSGWSAAASGSTTNVAAIQFPTCGATGATITHVSVGRDNTGAGLSFYYGAVTSPLAVSSGIQPQFAASSLTVTEA